MLLFGTKRPQVRILSSRPKYGDGHLLISVFSFKSGLNLRPRVPNEVRDEGQRLRAPPVADTASRGWRRGRFCASDSECQQNRAPQEGRAGNRILSSRPKQGEEHLLFSLFSLIGFMPASSSPERREGRGGRLQHLSAKPRCRILSSPAFHLRGG